MTNRLMAISITLPRVLQDGYQLLKVRITKFGENPTVRTYSIVTTGILAFRLMLIPWMLPEFSLAASQVAGEAVSSASGQGIEKIADGSGEDTLMACLARVPKEASPAQRLVAVDRCKQEEVVRILSRIKS